MGKLVVTEFVSLDGVFEDPGGAEGFEYGGWTFEYNRGEDGDKFKMNELMEADVQLLGRKTYEGFAAAWPSREGPFADKINNGAKYVVSNTLTDPEWGNTTVISGDATRGVAKLKDETEGAILVAGSGALVQTLLAGDLVDELRLMVFPTILGRGRRLFPEGIDRLKFKLAESRTVGPDGVQVQVYTRAEAAAVIDQPTAGDALRALEPLVGEWVLAAVGADAEPWPGEARAKFEWHPSGAHLVQTVTIDMPEAPDSVSIIGCDAANGTYYQLYSDDRGVCRVFEMSISETEWNLWREGAPFPQRFIGRFEDGGRRIAGRWEKSDDGTNYTLDFDLTFVRVQ
jgi:dihydrofolate reductase